jgi:hypothetical protein
MRLVVLFLLFFSVAKAQDSTYVKSIDSINQINWKRNSSRLDSISQMNLSRIYVEPVDTLVINPQLLVPNLPKEIPITPYNLLRTKDARRWFYYGENNLIFNQSSFSNWNSGGNNNIGLIGKISYQINYKKDRHFLDYNIN